MTHRSYYSFKLGVEDKDAIFAWCNANFGLIALTDTDRWRVSNVGIIITTIRVYDPEDAVLFRLQFADEVIAHTFHDPLAVENA